MEGKTNGYDIIDDRDYILYSEHKTINDELVEALTEAIRIADSWAHDQLDGTSGLKGALKELEPLKQALESAKS